MGSPLGVPYNPLPPGIRPDGGVNMLAMNAYGASDPATTAGLGLPQQIGGVSQNYDGDPEVLRQAYAEQEARLGPMRLPSETSDEGLGLPSTTSAQPVSSGGGGGDFSWLMALGGALQSGGAAHFGNFSVPQQYFQLKQQRDQMAAQAEERKQTFAMQQQKLAEEQKQHAFQQVTAVLTNKDASESQKATLLEELAKGNNPQIAQFARTAMDGIGKKRLSRIGLYMDRYPGQMQKLAEGMMKGSVSSDDIDARLGLIDEIEKHNAKITGEMELESEIKNNPNAPPGAKSWLAEREAKRMKEQAEANVKNQTQKAEIENANLKPDVSRSEIARNNAPKEAYSAPVGTAGEVETGIYDPKTGKLETRTGVKPAGVNVNIDTRKFTPEQAGRVGAMNSAIESLRAVKDKLFNADGTVDRTTLFTSNLFGGLPFTEGRDVNRMIEDAIETKLRLETGAAANKDEIKRIAQRYRPANGDSDETILGKLTGLERYMQQSFNVLDPTGEVRGHITGGSQIDAPPSSFDQVSQELKKKGLSKAEIFEEMKRRGIKP